MEITSQADLPNKRISIQLVSGVLEEVRIWFWDDSGLCQWNGEDLIASGKTTVDALKRITEFVSFMPTTNTPITPEEFTKRKNKIYADAENPVSTSRLLRDLMVETLRSNEFDA